MVPSHPGALVLAPSTTSSSHHRRNDGAGAGGGGNGPLESWLRASRAIAGGAAFLLALAGAHVRVPHAYCRTDRWLSLRPDRPNIHTPTHPHR